MRSLAKIVYDQPLVVDQICDHFQCPLCHSQLKWGAHFIGIFYENGRVQIKSLLHQELQVLKPIRRLVTYRELVEAPCKRLFQRTTPKVQKLFQGSILWAFS